jgi:hypothetical protein
LYGAETLIFLKVDQKYMESFEILWWRRMEIIWTDHVRNANKCYIQPSGKKHPITIKRGKG